MKIQDMIKLGLAVDKEAQDVHKKSIKILERLRDIAIESHDDVTAEVINKNLLDLKRLIRDSE